MVKFTHFQYKDNKSSFLTTALSIYEIPIHQICGWEALSPWDAEQGTQGKSMENGLCTLSPTENKYVLYAGYVHDFILSLKCCADIFH
jgi:hypothetical protein